MTRALNYKGANSTKKVMTSPKEKKRTKCKADNRFQSSLQVTIILFLLKWGLN